MGDGRDGAAGSTTNVTPAAGLGSSAEALSRARPFPLGATVVPGGVVLSLYA